MNETFYFMEKSAWNHNTGEYSLVEKVTGPLTLKQVRARVKRLPDTTVWLWTIFMYRIDNSIFDSSEIIGSVNADEFIDDVSEY